MKVKESLQVLAAALMVLALAGYASAATTGGIYTDEPSQMPKKPDCKKTPNDPACKKP